jgi:subtilisin family serine protease
MKKLLLIMLIAGSTLLYVFVLSCTPERKIGLFYYGTTEKVMLSVPENKIIIKFSPKAEMKDKFRKLEQFGKADKVDEQVFIITLQDKRSLDKTLETLKKESDVISANPIYTTKDNQEIGVTDEICLEFNKEVKDKDKKDFFDKFKVVEVRRTQAWEKYFTIVTVGKDQNALEVANRIKESGLVKFSHPNFYAMTYKHSFIPNDQFFPNQFYLNNTGQATNDGHFGTADADIDAPEAWDITRGANTITIAVIDEGVERTNNDLPAARLTIINGSNFAAGNANDPDAAGDGSHGTCCAGIIGAEQNNTQGVSGIAPLCNIMPIRIPFGMVAASTYANAINFAWSNGADVLSNSWGYGSATDIPAITAAINNAITMGRSGTGSVVVWSAGNTANHNGGNAGIVTFPGNVAVANVLTVGASDRNDQQANYSPTSVAVDVVAPSHRAYSSQIAGESFEVWSTDIIGAAGYNPTKDTDGGALPVVGAFLPTAGTNSQDYTGRMGGTSASCPEVAGVAALILSVNPTFTPAQVFTTITNSADKVGGFTYTSSRCNQMGFGRLNAFNALSPQLWMKDTPNDPGTEPNPTSDPMYVSDDIWVRKTNDGIQLHEDAEYKTSSPNSVYVRVRNSGVVAGNATLKLYWAKASSGLSWGAPWDGSVVVPALMGGAIGSKPTGMVAANGETIVQFDWSPPDPSLYSSFGSDQFHFCLLARIETSATAPYGMTFPEMIGNLWGNVQNNNNIVWKNMIVRDDVAGNAGLSGILVANYSRKEELTKIVFTIPESDKKINLYQYGDLTIILSDRLYKKWKEMGGRSEGVEIRGNEFKITSPNAWIGNFMMKPNEIYGLQVRYKLNKKPNIKNLKDFAFNFDVQQMGLVKDKWLIRGGQRLQYFPLKRERK